MYSTIVIYNLLLFPATCNGMAPLIDQELEGIDREHADLTVLNQRLLDSFQMYHDLMKEAPVYGYSLKGMVPFPGVGPVPVPGGFATTQQPNMGVIAPQPVGQVSVTLIPWGGGGG